MKKGERNERRRIKKARNRGIFLCIFFAVIMLFTLFYTKLFSIKVIETGGNVHTSSSDIISISGIRFGDNIFKINTKEAKEKIETLPYVKTANITRENQHVLRIIIKERKEVFSIISDGLIYICDEEGRILSKNNTSNVYPIVKGISVNESEVGKNIYEENENLTSLKDILDVAIESDVIKEYTEIRLQKNDEFGLSRADNVKIDFGKSENIKNKFDFIDIALDALKKQGKKASLIKLNIDPPVAVTDEEVKQNEN